MIWLLSGALELAPAFADEFITLNAPEKLEVRETVSESAGTMSGAHNARTRANALIAGLFLSKSGTETKVGLGHIKIAPIVVPAGVRNIEERLRLCTNLKTTNGHYNVIGFAEFASLEDADTGTGMVDLAFESNHMETISDRYGDQSFIGRSYIATACVASQTSYYMPVSFSDDPDLLSITFEVPNGTVSPILYSVRTDGATNDAGHEMTCSATRRLTTGFDCHISYSDLFENEDTTTYSGLMQLVLTINNGRDASLFETRISVPAK